MSEAERLLRKLGATELDGKAFSDCRYLNCKALGISFCLRSPTGGHVDTVFLYRDGLDGYSTYNLGPLPYGLEWSDVSGEVVRKLGEPSDKFGGGRLPIGIGFETLGVDVNFTNSSWEDRKNPITFISVFEHQEQ